MHVGLFCYRNKMRSKMRKIVCLAVIHYDICVYAYASNFSFADLIVSTCQESGYSRLRSQLSCACFQAFPPLLRSGCVVKCVACCQGGLAQIL